MQTLEKNCKISHTNLVLCFWDNKASKKIYASNGFQEVITWKGLTENNINANSKIKTN